MATKTIFSIEQLTERWEDLREIKNLSGKYANLLMLNREQEIVKKLWSKNEGICLGFNNGYYKGREAVGGYYRAIYEGNVLKAKLLQARFPEKLGKKDISGIYGIGDIKAMPPQDGLIEIAADGLTAKGLWCCMGQYIEVKTAGPLSYNVWGYYAADYIYEDDKWKFWHLLVLKDVDILSERSWGKPEGEPYPELPEFKDLKNYKIPGPNVPMNVRELYTPVRPFTPSPRIPEPYKTFSETFSYGI